MGNTQGYPCEGTPQDTQVMGTPQDNGATGACRGAQGHLGTRDTWGGGMWGIRGIQEHLHGWGHHDPRDRRWGQCGIRGCEDSARAGHSTSGTPRLSCPLSCDPTSPVCVPAVPRLHHGDGVRAAHVRRLRGVQLGPAHRGLLCVLQPGQPQLRGSGTAPAPGTPGCPPGPPATPQLPPVWGRHCPGGPGAPASLGCSAGGTINHGRGLSATGTH